MLANVMLTVTAALAFQGGVESRTDTTFAVPAGTRLSLQNAGGEIVIRTWDRQQVRVQADHSSRVSVGVELSGSVLGLNPRSARGGWMTGGMVDYQLTVPAAMSIEIQGMYADVTLEGTRGDVKVNTVEGNLIVKGGGGTLSLTTINGKIDVQGARGRVELRSTSDDVEVSDVQGDLLVEAVSGNITLRRIDGRRVEAQTVSGDVSFDGAIRNDGSYTLLTHSGDITFAVPEGASATIRAGVASGDIGASFQLPAAERRTRRRQVYRLGNGSATVELETFSGDVRLVRPSEIRPREKGGEAQW